MSLCSYDLVGDYEGVWSQFEEQLGFGSQMLISMTPNATRVAQDRHELIAEGCIGKKVFRRIMTDRGWPRFRRYRTPKPRMTATDGRILKLLRDFSVALEPPGRICRRISGVRHRLQLGVDPGAKAPAHWTADRLKG
jgi:hypothetical protein